MPGPRATRWFQNAPLLARLATSSQASVASPVAAPGTAASVLGVVPRGFARVEKLVSKKQ